MPGKCHFSKLYTFVQLGKCLGKCQENEGKYGKWYFAYNNVTENARKMTRKMTENTENGIFEACETRKMMGYVYKDVPIFRGKRFGKRKESKT
jgi:hypothetical protein